MKISLATYCSLVGSALICATLALPAAAQSHDGGTRGSGASRHADGARIARGGRYGGGWQRGGPGWWDVGPGMGWGWGWSGAYYLGYPYAWSPGYDAQYDSQPVIDIPPGQILPPSDYGARLTLPVTPNWYYCVSLRSYYPYAGKCPEAWQVVPAVPAEVTN